MSKRKRNFVRIDQTRAYKDAVRFIERMRKGRNAAGGLSPYSPATTILAVGAVPNECRKPRELVPDPPLGIGEAVRKPRSTGE